MHTVKITGLSIAEGMKPSERGNRIIAWFNCDVGVFSLTGCALIRTARNGVGVRLPKLDNAYGASRSVKLNCDMTRNAMMQAARDVYRMMGGTEAEWTGRDDGGERVPPRTIEIMGRQVEAPVPFVRKEPRAIEETDAGEEDRTGLETFLGSNELPEAQANGGE